MTKPTQFRDVLVTKGLKVGGSGAADNSAALEIDSEKGLLIPRVTEADRDAISTPATGLMVYNTDSNAFNYFNGVSWVEVGTGSGSGFNYIKNPDAEKGTDGWGTYADAAGTQPVDGAGGSPDLTFVRNTSYPLRGNADFKLSKPASNCQGQGVSYELDLDVQDYEGVSVPLYVSFDYITGSGYSNQQLRVYAIIGSSVYPIENDDGGYIRDSGSLPSRFVGRFYTQKNFSWVKLAIHVAGTSTDDYSLYFDNVKVSPDVIVPGNDILFQSSTLSGAATTGSSSAVTGALTASSGSGLYSYDSGTGVYTALADLDEVTLSLSLQVGDTQVTAGIMVNGSTVAADYTGVVGAQASTSWSGRIASGGTWQFRNFAGAGSSDARWASVVAKRKIGAMLSTTETMFLTPDPITATSSEKTPSGDNYHQMSGNSITILQPGKYKLWGVAQFGSSGSTPAYGILGANFFAANGADSGTAPASLSTVVDILSDQPAGLAGYVQHDSGSFNIVRVAVPEIIVEVKSVPTTIYLVPYSAQATEANARITVFANAQKIPDFSVFSMYGQAGDFYEAYSSTATSFPYSSDTYGDLTSLTLPPGEYDMSFSISTYNVGSITIGNLRIGIGTASGSGTTGLAHGRNFLEQTLESTSSGVVHPPVSMSGIIVRPTATTTYYLKATFSASAANLQTISYRMTARKIK
jgi:hypothetical protein